MCTNVQRVGGDTFVVACDVIRSVITKPPLFVEHYILQIKKFFSPEAQSKILNTFQLKHLIGKVSCAVTFSYNDKNKVEFADPLIEANELEEEEYILLKQEIIASPFLQAKPPTPHLQKSKADNTEVQQTMNNLV